MADRVQIGDVGIECRDHGCGVDALVRTVQPVWQEQVFVFLDKPIELTFESGCDWFIEPLFPREIVRSDYRRAETTGIPMALADTTKGQ